MSVNGHQTWRQAWLGSSRGFGEGYPVSAPDVDLTQGGAHSLPAGFVDFQTVDTAAASPIGVATPVGRFILIALRAQPARRERGRGLVLPSGRRSVVASRLPQIAFNFVPRLTAPRQRIEPIETDARACKPVAQSHLRLPSSFVASDVKQHSERQNGTVLYHRGEFHDQQGAPQHESC